MNNENHQDVSINEEFKCKNRYILFYQFEIKAAEKKNNKNVIVFIITSKIFLVM